MVTDCKSRYFFEQVLVFYVKKVLSECIPMRMMGVYVPLLRLSAGGDINKKAGRLLSLLPITISRLVIPKR